MLIPGILGNVMISTLYPRMTRSVLLNTCSRHNFPTFFNPHDNRKLDLAIHYLASLNLSSSSSVNITRILAGEDRIDAPTLYTQLPPSSLPHTVGPHTE